MRIKEFLVTRYGPIKYKVPFQLRNFNLFFGKNEEGKSLTIDALVKLLLGSKKAKKFEHIDRVEEKPEGYITLEIEDGKEIKLPEQGELTKFVDLSPLECSNIFIIRNSELSIANESELYANITDRLTGLRTEEISKINNALRDIGKITPKGTFRDIKDEKLKTRIEKAESLIERIKEILKRVKKEGLDKIEEKFVKVKEDIETTRRDISILEDAQKREKYEKARKALGIFKDCLEKIKELDAYNQSDEQLWRQNERDIKRYQQKKAELLSELKEKKEALKRISKTLKEKKQLFEILEDKKKILDNEIKPLLRDYEKNSEKLITLKEKSTFFVPAGVISIILFISVLIGIIVKPSLLLDVLAGVFLISAITLGILRFRVINIAAQTKRGFERIKLALAKLNLGAENIQEILLNVQKFDEKYFIKSNELGEIREDKGILKSEVKRLEKKQILEIESEIEECEEKINSIKRKTGDEFLSDYAQKNGLKQKFAGLKREQEAILESFFGKSAKPEFLYWEKRIKDIEGYKAKSKGVKYSENAVSELKKKKESLQKEQDGLKKRIESFSREMEEVERNASNILLGNEYLYCKTSVDLLAIQDRLQEFIDENERNKAHALQAIQIFKKIESDEEEKISELFGADSPISKYFSNICKGLYKTVIFDQKNGLIEVKRKDGTILKANQLSGGTYDQLYLSIRIALGQKLLKDKKGFFIMDDPFIKADMGRLQTQLGILKNISSELGWQIIYFSAKNEVKECLKKYIDYDKINYIEL